MKVFVASDNIVSPLGSTSIQNFENLKQGISGIRYIDDKAMSQVPFYGAAIQANVLETTFHPYENGTTYTRLEKMFIASVADALNGTGIHLSSPDTLLIVCTTKGNIDLFEPGQKNKFAVDRAYLHSMAETIATYFQAANEPLVISNACISGMVGIIAAKRLIDSGQYAHVVVAGGDIISEFTISGFHAFKAISPEPCRPYDAKRSGVTLGEGCGTMVITGDASKVRTPLPITISGGATSNDANHISGPSRDGEGLYLSIRNAVEDADITAENIDYVSGHGTATLYNDEMEAKALALGGLNMVPLNSFKSYFGHTLGAAGVIEAIMAVHSLSGNLVVKSLGFETSGVSEKINVAETLTYTPLKNTLKTGAGFGGCNAAIVFSKEEKQSHD